MTILDQLADHARERVAYGKEKVAADEMRRRAFDLGREGRLGSFAFEKALKKPGISFICECKKASPSKGLIAPDFPYLKIAKEYEAAGADCISVLTEPKWFLGSDAYLREIAESVGIPCLRKDFTVDEYMIYEAKLMGADAVLLICAILTDEELKRFFDIADGLGLTALVEAHDQEEVNRALTIGARLIGVNNRDLHTFTIDINNSIRYRQSVPEDVLFVSESGIKTKEDIRQLMEHNVNGVLIGETMMRADDRVAAVKEFIGYAE